MKLSKEDIESVQVFINIIGQDTQFVNEPYPINALLHDIYAYDNLELKEKIIYFCKKYHLITLINKDFFKINPIVPELIDRQIDYLDADKFYDFIKNNFKDWVTPI